MKKRFSPQYRRHVSGRSPVWLAARSIGMALFLGRDALLPILPARHYDHLHYGGLGHELPIVDALPLHPITHAVVGALRKVLPRSLVSWLMRTIALFWLCCLGFILMWLGWKAAIVLVVLAVCR